MQSRRAYLSFIVLKMQLGACSKFCTWNNKHLANMLPGCSAFLYYGLSVATRRVQPETIFLRKATCPPHEMIKPFLDTHC
jgi:hypothetical protein